MLDNIVFVQNDGTSSLMSYTCVDYAKTTTYRSRTADRAASREVVVHASPPSTLAGVNSRGGFLVSWQREGTQEEVEIRFRSRFVGPGGCRA
jgi:hypothetical protein